MEFNINLNVWVQNIDKKRLGRDDFNKYELCSGLCAHTLPIPPLIFDHKHLQSTQLHIATVPRVHCQPCGAAPREQEASQNLKHHHHPHHLHRTACQDEVRHSKVNLRMPGCKFGQYWAICRSPPEEIRYRIQEDNKNGGWHVHRNEQTNAGDFECLLGREGEEIEGGKDEAIAHERFSPLHHRLQTRTRIRWLYPRHDRTAKWTPTQTQVWAPNLTPKLWLSRN